MTRGTAYFGCEELTNELANLGCWRDVDAENYRNNCLYIAFKLGGVGEAALEAMKVRFLRRNILEALDLIGDVIRATFKVNVKGFKINSCDGTPRQHKKELWRLFKRLRIRFQRFREDIEQLLLDLQQVLHAGIANCFHVKYINNGMQQKVLHRSNSLFNSCVSKVCVLGVFDPLSFWGINYCFGP